MLDLGVIGNVSRISQEAPVPVLHVKKQKQSIGGAGLVAHNIKNMQAEPILVGVAGNDETKELLYKEFYQNGINTYHIIVDEKRKTTEKVRYFGNGQNMLRIDYENTNAVSGEVEEKLIATITKLSPEIDFIIISDYGKGAVTEKIVRETIALAQKHNKKVLVDGKPQKINLYKDADVVTFNESEGKEIITHHKGKEDQDIALIAGEITKKYNVSTVITRGKKGMTISEKSGRIDHIKGKEVEVADIMGAGDTVTAVLALALAADNDLFEAGKLANYAGGVVVTKKGSATICFEDIQKFLRLDVYEHLQESIRVKQAVIEQQIDKVEELAAMMIDTYKKGNKLLVFGNGGSAADAQHFAAEIVGRYKMERKGLPAIALTTDTSIITSIGNDYGYDMIFARQVEAHCKHGDLVLGISTSGNSPNVLKAFDVAKKHGARTVVWTGKDGGKCAEVADLSIIVPSDNTPRIQEAHITLLHIICEIFEENMRATGHF